ncbi:MAG: serine hydrolase domain-containing protein, partial [Candidatus Aminicenantes bacterium]
MKIFRYSKVFVLGFLIVVCLSSWNLYSLSVDFDDLTERMNSEIQKTMIEGKIPSVTVALVREDKIVWTGSVGYSNLWARTPAVPSTVYLIGSTFKTMSMFALLQQMEVGKFNLDDRVNDYLEDFKIRGENPANPVTFRHLLTHTSGLPEAYGAHLVWGITVPPSLTDYLASS